MSEKIEITEEQSRVARHFIVEGMKIQTERVISLIESLDQKTIGKAKLVKLIRDSL